MTRRPQLPVLLHPIGQTPGRDLRQGDHVCYPRVLGEDAGWATGTVTRAEISPEDEDRWLWIESDDPGAQPDTVARLQYRERVLILTDEQWRERRGIPIYLDNVFPLPLRRPKRQAGATPSAAVRHLHPIDPAVTENRS